MKRRQGFTTAQWKTLASAGSNIGQAIILFSFAAFFVPQTVNLPESFSKEFALLMLTCGMFFLLVAVIMSRKGGEK